jgi:hypothetical protein
MMVRETREVAVAQDGTEDRAARGRAPDGSAAGASKRGDRLRAPAARLAALAIIAGALLAVLGLHGVISSPAASPQVTATASPAAGRGAASAAAPSAAPGAASSGVPPFPSVGPDATSTTGLIEPGQVAVYADAAGPAVLVRVRDVQTLASVPGLTPRVEGDVYLEATVDFRVLHVPAGPFPGIGFIAWKTFGATLLDPDASWPTPHLGWVSDLQAGMTMSGRLGWEAPASGEVRVRYQESGTAYFEVLLRAAPAGPLVVPAPQGWPVTLQIGSSGEAVLGPDGSVYLAGNDVAGGVAGEPGQAIRLDASGRLAPGWPVRLPFAGWVSAIASGSDGTFFVAGAGTIAAFAPDGAARAGWPVTVPGATRIDTLLVGSDGTLYATYAAGPGLASHLVALGPDGTARAGWPVTLRLPTDGMLSAPLLGPDGTLYVAVTSETWWQTNAHGTLHAFTRSGSEHAGWPVVGWDGIALAPDGTVYAWRHQAASTPDGRADTIASTELAALDASGQARPGWPVRVPGAASAPVFGSDGTVYLTLGDPLVSRTGSLVALDRAGRSIPGWPVALPAGMVGLQSSGNPGTLFSPQPPVVASDGTLYVAGGTATRAIVAAFDGTGRPVPGWPYALPDGTRFGSFAPFATPGGPPMGPLVAPRGVYLATSTMQGDATGGGVLLLGPNGQPAAGWPQELPSHAGVSWVAPTDDGGVAVMGEAVTADASEVAVVVRYRADGGLEAAAP